jgi:hypothetical protein
MRPRFARTHDERKQHSPRHATRTRHTLPTTHDTTIPPIITTPIRPQQDRLLDRLATDTGRSDHGAQSMPLTIKPPRPPSEPTAASSQPSSSNDGSSSPVAPAYSPITPKVQPALPVVGHSHHGFEVPPIPPTNAIPDMMMHDDLPPEQPYDHPSQPSHPFTGGKAPIPPPAPSAIPETEYIPEPPSSFLLSFFYAPSLFRSFCFLCDSSLVFTQQLCKSLLKSVSWQAKNIQIRISVTQSICMHQLHGLLYCI